MFTLTQIIAAKPDNSPISTGDYWADLHVVAEEKVKQLCRRKLESANYTDRGLTTTIETDAGTRYVWYLREPTGSVIAYASFTTLTIDDAAVTEGDVVIEADRLVFESGGEVVAAYPGGWLANATATKVLRQAVIAAMHILHQQLQNPAATSGSGPAGGYDVLSGEAAWAGLREILAPYTALELGRVYANEPD
ncbi:hypothetical protein FJY70_01135 [candidate division WOR-3 bacterium]|nr:hypothetical protein [candidate division WOR-3 bacterium]MBM3314261.1 hypothetical protein [candidate division WOR-3 bacterium]